MFRLLQSILFRFEPERAHGWAASVLRWLGRFPWLSTRLRGRFHLADPRLEVRFCGLDFPSPIGVAAGFDKGDGLAEGLFALGFGFVEVGTITPRPQAGNPAPRLFRLRRQRALINRMGFNNAGMEATAKRYANLRFRPGPLGFNLGKNKDTPQEDAGSDYLKTFEALRNIGDYFVVNVSSPNTPGLRALQTPDALRSILVPLKERAKEKPVLLKLAPDLLDEEVDELADLALELGIDGLILANTTIGRPGAENEPLAKEAGGMSGAPLLERAITLVARVYRRTRGRLPLVGVGGIFEAEDAYRMIRAGASLVQAYTGFIYQGPSFARSLERGLVERLQKDGLSSIEEAVGKDAISESAAP